MTGSWPGSDESCGRGPQVLGGGSGLGLGLGLGPKQIFTFQVYC